MIIFILMFFCLWAVGQSDNASEPGDFIRFLGGCALMGLVGLFFVIVVTFASVPVILFIREITR